MKVETIKVESIRPETIKTGTILEMKKDYAILLSNGMAFSHVKKKEGMAIGQTIYYLDEDIYRFNKINYKNLLVYVASLCFMLILVYSATQVVRHGQQTPVSYGIVTLDINPSVEIHINEAAKVLRIRPLNEDAKSIILGKYSGMVLEDVLDILTNNAIDAGFLKEDGMVMLTYTVVNQGKKDLSEGNSEDLSDEDENYKRIETYMEKKRDHYKFLFAKGTEESVTAAKSKGLSVGKYIFMKYMSEDINLEEIKEMSIEEIFDIINHTDFEYNFNGDHGIKKRKGLSEGPPEHSNASDQGRLSAQAPQSPQEDQSQSQEEKANTINKEKEKPTTNSNNHANSSKDKSTPNNKNVDEEKTNSSNKDVDEVNEKENLSNSNVNVEKTNPSDIEKEIPNNSNADKEKINNGKMDKETEKVNEEKETETETSSISDREKTNNGISNQDNTKLEEVKDRESEKEKDTTKVNSGKSETKTNTNTNTGNKNK